MDDLERREVAWAEHRPDLYGGDECDELVPGWHCYADGDKDSEDGVETLELAAATFPPGSKVVISEPVCPSCGDYRPRGIESAGEPAFKAQCDCGFDWDAWVSGEFA